MSRVTSLPFTCSTYNGALWWRVFNVSSFSLSFVRSQSVHMGQRIAMANLQFHRKRRFLITFYSVDRTSRIFASWTMFHVYRTIRPLCKCTFRRKINQISSRNSHCRWCHILLEVRSMLATTNPVRSAHWLHQTPKVVNYRKAHLAYRLVNRSSHNRRNTSRVSNSNRASNSNKTLNSHSRKVSF